jgi:WXG100 family type VII secretion target
MPHLRIQVETVEDLARQVQNKRENEVEALLTDLRRLNGDLNGAWDGPAQIEFEARYGDWITQLQKYSETLRSVSSYLRSVAENYRQLDEAARQAAAGAAQAQ